MIIIKNKTIGEQIIEQNVGKHMIFMNEKVVVYRTFEALFEQCVFINCTIVGVSTDVIFNECRIEHCIFMERNAGANFVAKECKFSDNHGADVVVIGERSW